MLYLSRLERSLTFLSRPDSSQTARPRRAVVRRVRASPAGASMPRLPTMAVTVMPVKGYRATRTNRLPLLAPRGKTALLSPADAVLAVAKQRGETRSLDLHCLHGDAPVCDVAMECGFVQGGAIDSCLI